ncbi:MAG: hypothetical protein JSU68_10160 [Phycisphaerales bacterium]|nr:MAG: hypothetical protein JSU68_10160 [Phycisphaerales bacterium]
MRIGRLIRCAATLEALLLPGVALAQTSAHHAHPPMPDQEYSLHCRLDGGDEPVMIDVSLDIPTPVAPAELDQPVKVPSLEQPLRVKRYLPRATLEQEMVADEGASAGPGVQISIDGPTQSHQLWLLAKDAQHNRLISLIGTWRYQSVANQDERDELLRQFKEEWTRAPMVRVSRLDGSGLLTLPADPGTTQAFEELKCSVRVLSFYPHFSMNKETAKPENRSEKRENPAALVEIEHQGRKEERWVFARFPDFKAREKESLPFKVTLDCPLEPTGKTPDFLLVLIGREDHEVWVRFEGAIREQPIAVGEKISVPGSQYTFHIAQFIPSGRLIENYRPAEGRGGVPALLVDTAGVASLRGPIWLQMGEMRVIGTEVGPLKLWFGPESGATRTHPTPSH